MSISLIIARYQEDISWLDDYNNMNKIIYNKGEKIISDKYDKIINLRNVGRESHTWLYHIVNNYNNLDDINIFLQGRLDDLNCMAFRNPYDYLKIIDKYGFAVSRYGLLGPFHWQYNVGIENDIKYKSQWDNFKISRSSIGFRKFAKQLFPDIPLFVATSYGGCFAVKKELIRKYDINFYTNLLNKLNDHNNPIEGHYLERLWCYMFTKNKPIIDSVIDVINTKFERFKSKFMFKVKQ